MAKVECFTPDGEMKMKEPVDARECVENCGFTMEAPENRTINLVRKDLSDEVVSECTGETVEEVKKEVVAPAQHKRGRKKRNS